MRFKASKLGVSAAILGSVFLAGAGGAGATASGGSVGSLNGHAVRQKAGWKSALSSHQVASLSAGADHRVIVLLRNEEPGLAGSGNLSQRSAALASDQAPIVDQLHQLGANRVVGYHVVDAVATTVSQAEETNLAADPAVLAVVPDAVVRGPISNADLLGGTGTASHGLSSRSTGQGGGRSSRQQVCPAPGQGPLTTPEGLYQIHAFQAASLGYNGAGVKIAVFPDGVDPNLPDFQRSNGHGGTQSAVTDYQDFTGEGVNGVTDGAEAFGDVSSLVAQGKTTYNLQQEINPDFANPSPKASCDIRVLGVAPGADVDVMKVFGDENTSFDSIILQGLEYAVDHDHVNILSESFGEDAVPNPGTDPVSLFDKQAIADGITVVSSTGDAGTSNTEGEPALDPGVIGAAASTSYQAYAQINEFLYDIGQVVVGGPPTYKLGQPTPGWLDNQVSTLSSSGITETLRAPDIIAPGDSNWADCSTNTAIYQGCANPQGGSTIGLELFGGTSESAPLTSGTAALVIQAYRQTHGGQTPSPATVKDVIMSTASDIDVPADEMGAGLLNAYRAVQLARSWGGTSRSGGLTHSPTAISALGSPGSTQSATVQVTNSGARAQTVAPALRELSPARTLAAGSMPLSTASSCHGVSSLTYYTGEPINELNCTSLPVPGGVDQLDASIGWNPNAACSTCTAGPPTVREILIDPQGRYSQYSDPQGDGSGYADEQVHNPTPGRWTLVIFARTTSVYTGPVAYSLTGASYQNLRGVFSPTSQTVAPGRTATFRATIPLPANPGDQDGSIVLGGDSSSSASGTIPVILRSEVPVTPGRTGAFTGTLTGGNGRPNLFGQELTYQFTVPPGVHDVDVNLTAGADGYVLLGQLDTPGNQPVDSQFSYTNTSSGGAPSPTRTTSLTWYNPAPGTWSLHVANVLTTSNGVFSGLTSAPLQGSVSFNRAQASVTGLGNRSIAPGSTVTAQVHVTNNGVEPENYFIDPRDTTSTTYPSPSATVSSGTLPITTADTFPQYIVPPFSTQLVLTASTTGPVPIDFTPSPAFGSPEYLSTVSTASAPASVSIPNPIASEWGFGPTEIGPFGSGTAPTEPYSSTGTVTTATFDPNVSSDTGDAWASVMGVSGAPYSPLFLAPGQSGTINVKITVPSGAAPESGDLYLETLNANLFPEGSSDVLTAFPYRTGP